MGFLRRGGALLGNTWWRRDVGNERLGAADKTGIAAVPER